MPPKKLRSSIGAVRAAAAAATALTAMVVLASPAGCSKTGTSIIHVVVDARPSLAPPPAEVQIVVSRAGVAVTSAHFPWSASNDFGIRLPAGVTGTVSVSGEGYDAATLTRRIAVAEHVEMVAVRAGGVSELVTLHLIAAPPDGTADGGTGGVAGNDGSAGTGGAMGTGGGAGPGTGGAGMASGGSGSGTGGAATGGGGAATGGRGGAVGSGGAGNTGGAGGGAAGSAGGSTATWRGETRPHPGSLLQDTQPALAVDAAGNVVVAYLHGASVWASKFSAATGTWGTPGAVDGRSGSSALAPSIAVDKNGAYLVVWAQTYDNPMHGVWQSTSADGVTWTAPAAITTMGRESSPVMAMNRDGVAVAAWTDTVGGSNFTMTASVRSAGGVWSPPRVLRPAMDNGDRSASVAVTGRGDALVAWEQADGGTADKTSAWMARYAADTGWAAAALLESYDADIAFAVGVAANGAGQAIFTWLQYTASTAELWARRMSADGVLAAPAKAGEGTNIGWYPSPSVTLDESGTATLAAGFQVQGKYNVYTVRAPWTATATTWPDPVAMETDNAAADENLDMFEWSTYPLVGSDAAGDVVLVWRKRVGARFDLWARRFTGGAWGPAALIERQTTTASVVIPTLAIGSGGVAAAAWVYYAELQIWANVLR